MTTPFSTDSGVDVDISLHFFTMHLVRPRGVTDQTDSDGDGILDTEDNCPSIANQDQQDSNDNNVGDACDEEIVLPEGDINIGEDVEEAPSQDQPEDEGGGGENDGGDNADDTPSPEEPEPEEGG